MTFFAVVFGVMAISILLIHKLSDHFGCRLDYRSLVLCAVMAMVVTFGVVFTSQSLTREYYVKLGLLILAASCIVTAVDRHIAGRSPSLAVAGANSELTVENENPVLEKASSETAEQVNEPVEKVPKGPIKLATEVMEEGPPVVQEPVSESGPDAESEPKTSQPEHGSIESGKLAEPAIEVLPQKESAADSAPNTVQEPLAGDSIEPDSELQQLSTLDDLLDYAYEQRSKGNIWGAILANKLALARYPEDDYTPYIAIELGNIYKDQADYDSAIHVYEQSLNLASVARNDETYQEFAKNLSYLRTVKEILHKHNAQDIPFREIPQEYIKEVEADFQSRYN